MKTILIIEDDQSLRENIQSLLEKFGYNVHSAKNGLEGFINAKEIMPNLIISDIMMPELDGFDLISELQKNEETSTIPFIFLTAKTEISSFRRGMELGADDYLFKPFKAGQLLKAVEVRLQKKERILKGSPAENSEDVSNITSPDYSQKFILAGNPPEVIKVNQIVYIQSVEGYTELYKQDGKIIIIRKLLKEWENSLPADFFLRIHHSLIINLEYIQKIEKWFNHSFRVYLKNIKEPLVSSRRYSPRLRKLLNT